ncbi:MAG: hypothetical protein A2509_11685 [Candidatus Edwardsbacteria bacterium RIFOXYD12_FULL_50_11]|uniref:Peptidase C1A papain C-terminal domain-containing protein n=1 Tax=Candidatus Edwardsbacteria bacterium GWF2_54_11 TaxID=1817851 RepID=A0A1F5R224_9BACT|nr:MAG: hypothetical protein A2502_04365 [Candidatus Edwardsbacteria bacterium RifOxyC12_full_54_24]OGF08093.1 MAG: hypothetical protein A2024_05030 [Candidatus Edwardsbacteria bacterium GWF2_54_11]OGF08630.1 MAG: hypothetical protein A2273_06745 [Candidatus Edwardsbacteria bacterium RifOxyA12_full_54_48]OGF11274.1 MAG: hypothetical protein A3K15_02810 [Candidatus Edwardsbacteria bacterium GWE2_54_12]OGF16784.1 MAG: hypothetical protein A2509_11685 [Candidatus Edwardsbacteria bacterium RIFOXYD1
MKKIALILLILPAVCCSVTKADELHRLGLIWKDPRVTAPGHEIKVAGSKGTLPSSVDHSADMPPVGNQGGQGSCTAWATAYYHKSYQEWVEHNWSLADSNHLFSPSFVYNQINGGADNGSWFGDAFQVLCDMGSSSILLKPYNDGECTSWPSETAYDSAIPYRCNEWFWFDLSDDLGIEGVKQCLAEGNNVVIGLLVYANYDNISSYNNIFCVADLSGDIRGGHANCIAGYDDSLVTNDGRGAFRVVNSWGPSWGDGGYYWMSYQAATDSRTSYQAAFYSSDRIGYQPRLKMRARINHGNRGSVQIRAGVGPALSPDWSRQFYINTQDGYTFGGGDNPFPGNNIVLDLTEGVSYLDSTEGNNIYLQCRDVQIDGISGTVEYLGAESLDWGVANSSLETPNAIADDYDHHYTNVSLHYRDFGISADPAETTLSQGDSACFRVRLEPVNGFALPVCMSAQVTPLPSSGSISVEFDRDVLVPLDSCSVKVVSSTDASPGRYQVTVSGIDSLDTLTRNADLGLWVLGSGDALCIGSSSGMLNLARTRWGQVDSLSLMPPVIGGNYQALILENGLTMADSSRVSSFIGSGGLALSVGKSVYNLSGGSNLLPVSRWLGATGYAFYTGAGINVISDYQNPFGVASIDHGDTLGILAAVNGRLSGLQPAAVPLAHLGTVTSAIAAVYNTYGSGQSLWITAGAGFSQPVDSLITGFFGNPALGISNDENPLRSGASLKPGLSAYPSPFRQKSTFSLSLPGKSPVTLRIYDICGRMVKTVFEGEKPGGRHNFVWDGRDQAGKRAAAGVYFIKAETGYGKMLEKIISIR